jgi:hypothetical protein
MTKLNNKPKQQGVKTPNPGDGAFLLLHHSAPAISLSAVRIEDGVPVKRYRKELITTGKYIKAADGIEFEVTDDTLNHWVLAFAQWTASGNKVPVPLTHDNADNPENNRGWVVDEFREGDSLIGLIDLIGEDADKLAASSDVSIYTPKKYTDGRGNVYTWPITHVALCTNPLIPGLKGFEAIAASLAQPIKQETKIMDHKVLADLLGLTDITPENAEEKIKAAIADLKKKAEGAAMQSAEDEEKKKKEEEVAAAALAASAKKTADPVMVKLVTENRAMKLNALVAASKITPAVKDKLAKQFLDKDTLGLSLSSGTEDGFDAMITALSENNPVELAEQSGAQVIALQGGPVKDGGKSIVNKAKEEFDKAKKQNPNVCSRM